MQLNWRYFVLFIAIALYGCSIPDKAAVSVRHARQSIISATFSLDKKYVLFSTFSAPAQLWDLAQQVPKYDWSLSAGPEATITHVAIASNNQLAATAGTGQLVVWNLDSGQALSQKTFNNTIRAIALAPSTKLPLELVGQADGTAYYFSSKSNQLQWAFKHDAEVNAVALSEDGQYALTGSADRKVKLWSLATGAMEQEWTMSRSVGFVTFSHDSQYVLANAALAETKIWRTATGELLSTLQAPKSSLITADFNANADSVVTGSTSGELTVWNTKTGVIRNQWLMPKGNIFKRIQVLILAATFSSDGSKIMTETSDGFYREWLVNA